MTDKWNYEDATDEELKKICEDCGTDLDVFGCWLCDGRLP